MAENEKQGIGQIAADELPPEVAEVINTMPEEHREQVRHMWGMHMSMTTRTSPQMEVMKKLTPETLEKMIDNEAKEAEMEYRDRNGARWATMAMVLIGALFLLGVVLLLREDTEVLKEIVVPFVTLIAGALGGYGFGYSKGKRSE